MPTLLRTGLVLSCLPLSAYLRAQDEKRQYPAYDYDLARAHEIKPHRRTIPTIGVGPGFNQLRLTLIVSPAGDVVDARAGGEPETLKHWPPLVGEVRSWKFIPFEDQGKAVTAEVEEYIDLVPPERLPKKHVAAPTLKPNSQVTITLQRTGCFGSCPAYTVTASTDGITFEGRRFVVASGTHTDRADSRDVRNLAKRFVTADFYSMDSSYRASVTDNPTYVLSIAIDGRKKEVEDYVGAWEGMPAVISELEKEVDQLTRTARWIEGTGGLVPALQAEEFKFQTFEAQVMLKEAASRGRTETVRDFLQAGVPLEPLLAPKLEEPGLTARFENEGWLTAASGHEESLLALISVGASKDNQRDKDLALVGAARSGLLDGARALIAYGANPNADLSQQIISESAGGMTMEAESAGSVLIYAAESGNPDMVREILRYKPKLEARDRKGKTALFAAGEYRYGAEEGPRVECVRLLVEAGADVNARDKEGNTPLHHIYLTEVEEELLRLGADVNARNDEGETPIFTNVDEGSISLFIAHGADLTIHNNEGQTVFDVANKQGPSRQQALRNALQKINK